MKQLFDDKAASYDAWYQTGAGRYVDRVEKEAIWAYLEPRAGMTVLDVGCGTGNYTLELARAGVKATGVDISSGMLARAKAKAVAEGLAVEFIQADAVKLPFPDHCFDAVISVSALEFLPDLAAALRECYRVVKPGGRLVVGVIGRDSAWGRYYSAKAGRDPGSVFSRARLYTLDELMDAMPGGQIKARAVLFTPPDFDYTNEQLAREVESAAGRAGRTDGGFICAVALK